MRRVARDKRVRSSIFSLKSYIAFFLIISAVVSCCFLLFLTLMEVEFANVHRSALLTFGNVVFLSLLCCVVDGVRRKYSLERPLKRILDATHKIAEGDFSARIEPLHGLERLNEFDAIIQDFNKMAKELGSIETLRADFIASVSHELKTPLAVIQNYATMLQVPNLPEEKRREYAGAITNASRRFSELITNILKLNKLENQQIFPESSEYNLGEQVRECLLGFEDVWEDKGLHIDTDIDDILIQADAELLSLVWNNLISNAVKFTKPADGISIRVKVNGAYAIVQVADTGGGMSREVGEHIFEKFYQGDSSHSMQGNGLGLALVMRVVDILGGEISVESTLHKGSIFTVKLLRNIK